MLNNELLRNEVYSKVPESELSDEILKARFEKEKDKFVKPPRVKFSRILIDATDEAKAKAEAHMSEEMAKVTGGLQLPPGMKLPF